MFRHTVFALFWRQFVALTWKNWIILSKHPFLNILRCSILPIAYGIFLSVAQIFLTKPSNLGIGQPIPIYSFGGKFDGGLSLMWVDATNGTSDPSPSDVIAYMTRGFSPRQLDAVRQIATPADIPGECPQNFNMFSECFAAVIFYDIPPNNADTAERLVNYTIRADGGLFYVNVQKHTTDFEERILPLQWAIDKAIIELKTGAQLDTPLEWPFTQITNEQQATDIRLSYIRGLRTLLVLALFVCYIGIAYQLPGAVAGERGGLLTSHMKAMGLLDSARIMSWHFSLSIAYLPAWVIVGLIWHYRIFTHTSVVLVLIIHILLGLSLASYSFFLAAPFGKSPQLAAVVSTLVSIVFAIVALVMKGASTAGATVFTFVFPPAFYIFVIRAVCGFENHLVETSVLLPDPDNGLIILPLILVTIVGAFLWPYLSVVFEHTVYEVPDWTRPGGWRWGKRANDGLNEKENHKLPADTAISIRHLRKTFKPPFWHLGNDEVTAVDDLSLDIKKGGIYVLLGSNGAGKSTSLSIIGGLLGRTSGSILFDGNVERPSRGVLGIVPQKNVLFPDLTCLQTLKVWQAIKWHPQEEGAPSRSEDEGDLTQLLKDCDLGLKIKENAHTLSGGQKRKLQLAIGLVGGSKIVLVDECTSGVDPLSRRAIWRTLTSFRNERTIVFTTHFLDEADLLADHIAILAAPGKVVAEGTPVALKTSHGEGYTIQVNFVHQSASAWEGPPLDLITRIRVHAPDAYSSSAAIFQASYHLQTRDALIVQNVLRFLEDPDVKLELSILDFEIIGTTIEDVFLALMRRNDSDTTKDTIASKSEDSTPGSSTRSIDASSAVLKQLENLPSGRTASPLRQLATIFYKRCLIAKRSWLTPVIMVFLAVLGTTVPLVFMERLEQTCGRKFGSATPVDIFLPSLGSMIARSGSKVLASPPGIIGSVLGSEVLLGDVEDIADNTTFFQTISENYLNLTIGGISMATQAGGNTLIAWEATLSDDILSGPSLVNLATNILFNQALNSSSSSPFFITPVYQPFPPVSSGTLLSLKWVAFFGATMSIYPAFFALYVARERKSLVQAMQMSNGLTNPLGLWLGHLTFDTMFVVLSSTIITIVFAAASNQFHGLGYFWLVMVLYGITGALFAYCATFITASPLAAFAVVSGYQIVMFVLYLAGYLLTLTYAKTSSANTIITTVHFTLSVASPVASVMRAALVSVNLFSLLCVGSEAATSSSMGTLIRFGGPILYLIVYSAILLFVLVLIDSGSLIPSAKRSSKRRNGKGAIKEKEGSPGDQQKEDVQAEESSVATSDEVLRIMGVSKQFNGKKVVNNLSLGVGQDTLFALLGPNGAGKTTTFNMIRGEVLPDVGDILINDTSIVRHTQGARQFLGVCPQFTAIDSQLTVREHLIVYGRLKGLKPGQELEISIDTIMRGTKLDMYADRLASKLSGGNQRKLSLAIALMGNPRVVLIDEFSTGVDARMKREMWDTLRNVARGKAVLMTTHSMEEASALANKVGIVAKRLLAIGTSSSLTSRYATCEIHFSTRSREEVIAAQAVMAKIPGARMMEDVATRFEITLQENAWTLSNIVATLSSEGGLSEYTIEKATLESVFIKVIRESGYMEDHGGAKRRWC